MKCKIDVDGLFVSTGNVLQYTLDTYVKNSANRYMPTVIRVAKMDLCEIFKTEQTMSAYSSILAAIIPSFIDRFGHFMHPCPYSVSILFANRKMTCFHCHLPGHYFCDE